MYFDNQITMVQEQIINRGIKEKSVIKALQEVDRKNFVPDNMKDIAYDDRPLPIGYGQTISQPFIVAYMTESAKIKPDSKVLEIGTGCGYQSAILARLSKEVYTIEVIDPPSKQTKKRLTDLGYNNIHIRFGDGYLGWPEAAPFDVIIVTAAPPIIPKKLIEQLKNDGRMIIPVGSFSQELLRISKTKDGLKEEKLLPVRFVPMVKRI